MLDVSKLHPERMRPLKRSEYDRLVEEGVFTDERVELLYGVLVDMSPNNPAHASPIDHLTMLLAPALAGRAVVRVQQPIVAADESEPEPDIAVVPLLNYRREHPNHAELIVEVAVSSLNKDRNIKARLYAASGFREYWIVNVADEAVEVYRGPTVDGFSEVSAHRGDDELTPEAFPDVRLRVRDLFG